MGAESDNENEEAHQTELDKIETLSQASSIPDVIDRVCQIAWCLQIFVSLPMLVLYGLGSLFFLVYFMTQQYEYVLAIISVLYLALVGIYYAFRVNFKDFKVFMKKMFHRVLVELPKSIVLEMVQDANKTYEEIKDQAQQAKNHVDDHLDRLHDHCQARKDEIHEDLKDQYHEVTRSISSFLKLHKEKSKEKLETQADEKAIV
mmetsp:Transcript_82622/g.237504  ORF Transcript_82622/g.237504 Transcript_82622/m.237504 type:complete len:203 (+) Transcript_82622:64-672(+)